MKKSPFLRLLFRARDWRSRQLFAELARYCSGEVIDIGGWDFFDTIRKKPEIQFDSWTTVEPDKEIGFADEPRFRFVRASGCDLPFADESFDTAVNVQVLEHVYEPNVMFAEMVRVLRPGGHAILLVPQTSILHHAPHHYYNFTRFWLEESARRNNMRIVQYAPLGGRWSSTGSHLFHFFLQSARFEGMSTENDQRNPAFYALFPFMAAYAAVGIPLTMLFSLGDLTEEPNNHLIVLQKPHNADHSSQQA